MFALFPYLPSLKKLGWPEQSRPWMSKSYESRIPVYWTNVRPVEESSMRVSHDVIPDVRYSAPVGGDNIRAFQSVTRRVEVARSEGNDGVDQSTYMRISVPRSCLLLIFISPVVHSLLYQIFLSSSVL
jgi:hypothetical protein